MTTVNCNECGKDLLLGKKYTISDNCNTFGYSVVSYSGSVLRNVPETKDFCSYKCINHYTFQRLSE
jgi:hypothetical protein